MKTQTFLVVLLALTIITALACEWRLQQVEQENKNLTRALEASSLMIETLSEELTFYLKQNQ